METECITEEQITFAAGSLSLSGVLAYPNEQPPQRAVLLCSPHPHFAGDMDNNVIMALARHFAADSVTLRFDYRGVGKSEIDVPAGVSTFDYWQQVEDMRDYGGAVADVQAAMNLLRWAAVDLPCAVIGYSFGVATGFEACMNNPEVVALVGIAPPLGKVDFSILGRCRKPCMFIIGQQDFLYSAEHVDALRDATESLMDIRQWPDSDHFFRGEETQLADQIEDFFQEEGKD